jgi:hypothetical protein
LGDARLWLGLVLVVGAMLAGAVVMSAGRDTVSVLRATRDLAAGSSPADFDVVQVDRALVRDVYVASDLPGDAVLRWPVHAGELLARGTLAQPRAESVRRVTVPVEPLHAPAALNGGDRVDVWASPGSSSSDRAAPRLVLPSALVRSVAADAGVGGELGVVLDVPVDCVADVVEATRAGVVDLVAVPVDDVAAPDSRPLDGSITEAAGDAGMVATP